MAKILQTQLPVSTEENVTSEIFNRTVRVLELNLNAVDVDNTPQFNQTIIDKSKFKVTKDNYVLAVRMRLRKSLMSTHQLTQMPMPARFAQGKLKILLAPSVKTGGQGK